MVAPYRRATAIHVFFLDEIHRVLLHVGMQGRRHNEGVGSSSVEVFGIAPKIIRCELDQGMQPICSGLKDYLLFRVE